MSGAFIRLGLGSFDAEAWSKWRERLQPEDGDEPTNALEQVRRRRTVGPVEQLSKASAVCDAALLLMSRNLQRPESRNRLISPEYPALLTLGGTDVASFAENLSTNGIAPMELFEEFGQDKWRLLWDNEIEFHEDLLRYLLRPTVQARSTSNWFHKWRRDLHLLSALPKDTDAPKYTLHGPNDPYPRPWLEANHTVVVWSFMYHMIYAAVREAMADELVRLRLAIAMMLPEHPIVRDQMPKCDAVIDELWKDLVAQVFDVFGVPNASGYDLEKKMGWHETDRLALALRRQCMGAYFEVIRMEDEDLMNPYRSALGDELYDGIGVILNGYSRQRQGDHRNGPFPWLSPDEPPF